MKQLFLLRVFLVLMSLGAAIAAGALSAMKDYASYFGNGSMIISDIDSAADGGAAGFAIMSGLALVALSITFLRKE